MSTGNTTDDLDFAHHVKRYEGYTGHANLESDAFFTHEAQKHHSLVVQDALRDVFFDAARYADTLSDQNATYFMKFGVGRRLKMMWASYREILSHVPPDRTEPLSQDDVGVVSRDLNVIYINIHGVLDNYAWCLLHEVTTEAPKKVDKMSVGLFSSRIMSNPRFVDLKPKIDRYGDWNNELKKKRDPVAHRIPLYVPPAILNPEEAERYKEFCGAAMEATAKLEFEKADEFHGRAERLGTFSPHFMHHPGDGALPIYPTVPQDIANLVKIARVISAFLKDRAS